MSDDAWKEDLRTILLQAGTVGLTQSEILRRYKNKATVHELMTELEFLLAQDKVQKFVLSAQRTQWRATVNLLTETV